MQTDLKAIVAEMLTEAEREALAFCEQGSRGIDDGDPILVICAALRRLSRLEGEGPQLKFEDKFGTSQPLYASAQAGEDKRGSLNAVEQALGDAGYLDENRTLAASVRRMSSDLANLREIAAATPAVSLALAEKVLTEYVRLRVDEVPEGMDEGRDGRIAFMQRALNLALAQPK